MCVSTARCLPRPTTFSRKWATQRDKPGYRVLMIRCDSGVNYSREMFWIGLHRHITGQPDGVAVEYPASIICMIRTAATKVNCMGMDLPMRAESTNRVMHLVMHLVKSLAKMKSSIKSNPDGLISSFTGKSDRTN